MTQGDVSSPSSMWDGHLLLVFWTEQDRRTRLAAWIRRGLDRGEAIVYTGAPADRDALTSAVGEHAVAMATASGQFQLLAPPDLYPVSRPSVLAERLLGLGYPAVRFVARGAIRQFLRDTAALQRFEREVDELCSARPVSWLCELERAGSDAAWISSLSAAHHRGIREPNLVTRRDGLCGPLEVDGDIDIANADVMAASLSAAVAGCPDGLILDLRDLKFLDVVGCRSIVEGTRHFREDGGVVTILAATHIRHVLALFGVPSMLNFELGTPPS